MSDRYDDLIGDALGEFRAVEAVSGGPVTGVAAVHATVAHRRKVRITTFSVLGALLIAAPIAAFAANPRGNNSPPVPGDTGSPTPVVTASPTPVSSGPDGRITVDQLIAQPRDIPAVADCAGTAVRLLGPTDKSTTLPRTWVAKVVHTNLDADSSLETAALLHCQLGQTPESQVVAFDRDDAGQILSLGQVVGDGYMLRIRDISARQAGGISADVTNTVTCCDAPKDVEEHQTREYAWDGTRFTQVGGPTVYGDPLFVTDLQVIAADVILEPESNGKRSGAVKITIKNNGPNPSGRFRVGFGNCSFTCFPGVRY